MANAENNNNMDADDLYVVAAYADPKARPSSGSSPRAMGRGDRIRKRTSHITVCVWTRRRSRSRWVRKFIPAACGSASSTTGRLTGSPSVNSPTSFKEDLAIRKHIQTKMGHAGLSTIVIRKDTNKVVIDIYTARPGIVIGKSGSEVDALRREIHDMTGKAVHINIIEIKRPELDASLVAQSIAEQLANRVSFRRAMKRAITSAMRSGAEGIKVRSAGRLGGAEMARIEGYSEGRVPLHTLRADIDYGFCRGEHHLRQDRREGVDQQGRGHARRLCGGGGRPRPRQARNRRQPAAEGRTAVLGSGSGCRRGIPLRLMATPGTV